MSVNMQSQSARNLVLSPNQQAAYGGVLADAALTYRASIDPSTVFSNPDERYNDQPAAGKGTQFATVDIRTAWNSMATVKGQGGTEAWMLGWQLAFIFGQETATGAGPFTHAFTLPPISTTMPCTTVYVEDTTDVHRKYPDMAGKTLSINIPERGPIDASLEMVGTGRFSPGSFGGALPAVAANPRYLLGSDVSVKITPSGGALKSWAGRQSGIMLKIDRQTAPFKSSGDGLSAGSTQAGLLKFSLDATIMADATDDINTLYEAGTPCAISVATDPTLDYQLIFTFPAARLKAVKLGNKDNKVAWGISIDEGTCLQVGAQPAISASIINGCSAYLVPA